MFLLLKKIHKCYDVLTIVCVLIIETESSGFVFFLKGLPAWWAFKMQAFKMDSPRDAVPLFFDLCAY